MADLQMCFYGDVNITYRYINFDWSIEDQKLTWKSHGQSWRQQPSWLILNMVLRERWVEINDFLKGCLRGKNDHQFNIFVTIGASCWTNGSPSGTVPTLGALTRFLGDFSREGAEVAFHRPCSVLSTIVGLCLTWAEAVLGPQVFPFTPSPATTIWRWIKSYLYLNDLSLLQ